MRNDKTIVDEATLRELLGEPAEVVRSKITDRVNPLLARFIELSPFLCIATSGADGSCDVSPRGDPKGFVRILDEHTLLLPDRPGNRLADSLRNILENPRVGLLFLIPGVGETLRVNGRARLTTDPDLLEGSTVGGSTPTLGIIIEVEEVYTQCPKAFVRSALWDPTGFVGPDALPSAGEIHRSLKPGFDAEEYDRERAARYERREGLY